MQDIILHMKTCATCSLEKPISDFYLVKGRPRKHCKECTKQHMRNKHHTHYKHIPEFRERVRRYGREHHHLNKEANNKRISENHRKERNLCIQHYGPDCKCCGESRYEFLAIDHINGGGRKHRKVIGGKLARWLVRNGLPEGFRILCHNCNMALGQYGFCPHTKII